MPIYEYRCRECGKITEYLVQNPDTAGRPACPECKSTDMARVLSAPGIIRGDGGNPGSGRTCCGRTERCDSPPCSSGGSCHRG